MFFSGVFNFPVFVEFILYLTMTRKQIDEIRIQGVQPDVKNDLKAIAKNQGLTLASFLKPELRKIRDSYPDNMRIADPK